MAGSMGMGRSLGVKKFRINSKRGKDDPKAKEKDEREEREKLRSRKDKEGKDKKVKGATIPTGSKKSAPKKADEENDKKVKKSANKESFHDTIKEEQGKNYSDSVLSKVNSLNEKAIKEKIGKEKGLVSLGAAMDAGMKRSRMKNFSEASHYAGIKREAKGNTNDVVRETKGTQKDVNREAKGIQRDFGIEGKRNASVDRKESSLPDFPKARGASSGESASDRNPEPSNSVSSTSEKQRARNKGAELGR